MKNIILKSINKNISVKIIKKINQNKDNLATNYLRINNIF